MKKEITIVCIDTLNPALAKRAIELTASSIPYDTKVLTFSDKPVISGETRIPILPFTDIKDYSELCLKGLWPFIDTEHFIIVQYDGFATKTQFWEDDFLLVDYVGAIWPWHSTNRMGNGGFSLRSRKLLGALRDNKIFLDSSTKDGNNEDVIICRINRTYLEKEYSIKFAPESLAKKFSCEFGLQTDTFGMHGLWNIPAYCSEEDSSLFLLNSPTRNWNLDRTNLVLRNCMNSKYFDLTVQITQHISLNRPDIPIDRLSI